MNVKTRHIRARFQDKEQHIDLLIAQDSEFLVLAKDYDSCVDALRYWIMSNAPEAKSRILEYYNLIKELEEEISQYLGSVSH
jgi:hypothetical protein